MTLDEAISHALEVAEQEEKNSKTGKWFEGEDWNIKAREQCAECAADHRQLAEWLKELKQWRRVYGVCPSYEMCIPECKEGYNAQIAEYKRLLKVAVEDIHDILTSQRKITNNTLCHKCSYYLNCTCKDICETRCDLKQWRYGAEALKLIGENNDEP